MVLKLQLFSYCLYLMTTVLIMIAYSCTDTVDNQVLVDDVHPLAPGGGLDAQMHALAVACHACCAVCMQGCPDESHCMNVAPKAYR